jgi:energy-converting hydrogenase Eha subunit G
MTEIDVFLTGFAGGAIAAMGIALALYSQVKFTYDEKLKALQMQVSAIRSHLSSDIYK